MRRPSVVAKLRIDRGISQSELAAKLGCLKDTVGDWESGQRVPGLIHFVNWCIALGIGPNSMLIAMRASGLRIPVFEEPTT